MSRRYISKKMIHKDPWERYYFECPVSRQHKQSEDEVARAFRSVAEDVVIDAVFPLVGGELRKAANIANIIEKRMKNQVNPRALLDKEIIRSTSELNTINQRIGKLYENYVDKLLDEREYVAIKARYEGRAEALRQNIDSLSERAAVVADVSASNNHWIKAARDFQNPEALTRAMIEAIIEKVQVFSPSHIEVSWRFGDELKLLESIADDSFIGESDDDNGITGNEANFATDDNENIGEEDGHYANSDSVQHKPSKPNVCNAEVSKITA